MVGSYVLGKFDLLNNEILSTGSQAGQSYVSISLCQASTGLAEQAALGNGCR